MSKRFKWTVEIEVDEIWVADGFDLTDERLRSMLESHIGYATPDEVGGRVIKAPDQNAIRECQGYEPIKQR